MEPSLAAPVSLAAHTDSTIYSSPCALLSSQRHDGLGRVWRVNGMCVLLQLGLLASPLDALHATAPLPTYMLRMLPKVWFDLKQTVVRLEADRGSARSRPWFGPKHDSPTTIPSWHHDTAEAGELSCGRKRANDMPGMSIFRNFTNQFF